MAGAGDDAERAVGDRLLSAATAAIAIASHDPAALADVICAQAGALLAARCMLAPPDVVAAHELVVELHHGGQPRGALYLTRTEPFTDRDRALATALADHAAIALANAEAWTAASRVRVDALRLAALVEASGDALVGIDLDGRITSWNRAAHRLFGYSPADALGEPLTTLVTHGADPAAVPASLHYHQDGHELEVWVTSSPIMDGGGHPIGSAVVARDLAERRATERGIVIARDAAELADRELEAFSYSVAHDLRAPLRGIDGFARILLDDHAATLDHDGRDCLDEIRASARRMGELIDGLLSLSRVTRSELRPRRVDLVGLVRAAFQHKAGADHDREVELIVPAVLEVEADLGLARTAIDSLVANAWKFTAKRADAVIELGTVPGSAPPVFYVRDNGVGFDMTYAGKLFAPFQRLHNVREFPGTGIGLATVQRIIHRHGGRIWAEAAVDAGATVFFTLPVP